MILSKCFAIDGKKMKRKYYFCVSIRMKDFYINIIRKYLSHLRLDFDVKPQIITVFMFRKETRYEFTLTPSKTNWKAVKRRIYLILSTNLDEIECLICESFQEKVNNHLVACNKCGNSICAYCFVDIIKINEGLMICPFCRDTFGSRCSNSILEKGLDEVRKRFQLQK